MLKAYCKFKGYPDYFSNFKFPPKDFIPKRLATKEELKVFYDALPCLRSKAIFLMLATSGLRKGEVLSLRIKDVDLERSMIIPHVHEGVSKHSWVSFFNEEAEEAIRAFRDSLSRRALKSQLLFAGDTKQLKKDWKIAREKTKIQLKIKDLRDWFCQTMGELGVSDRFIDAFCGRTPKSVLARHYSDYSPERLKKIYDKAGLKVLF
ncbi:MAG: site-specific integrase [Candidatus Methylarchaceae archaeon HK01B]|nr:site-specific integrase [Candidatus Methylarchaceae archaeon HK01M]MCP8318681.1 site-specific integrase [Candidatus Methylarchaceae archaeon HK01B]